MFFGLSSMMLRLGVRAIIISFKRLVNSTQNAPVTITIGKKERLKSMMRIFVSHSVLFFSVVLW